MAPEVALSTGHAYGAATVIDEGQQTTARITMGGYARISNTTQMLAEEGEWMPSAIRYDTMIPFLPPLVPVLTTESILIRGGRDFILDLTVYDDAGLVQDITGAIFIAQVKRRRYSKYAVVQMSYEILDGPTGKLRLRLTPDQTSFLVRCTLRGVWDLEMQLNGIESTVIAESQVRVLPGISQGTMVQSQSALGTGVANNNA